MTFHGCPGGTQSAPDAARRRLTQINRRRRAPWGLLPRLPLSRRRLVRRAVLNSEAQRRQ